MGGTAFKPNAELSYSMPHGDLIAVEPALATRLREPRTVRFRTDNLGYRNDTAYDRHAYLCLGDSFLFGSGSSQEHLLINILRQEWNLQAYAIAFPVLPEWLVRQGQAFRDELPPDEPRPETLLFVFEGNDFRFPEGLPKRKQAIAPPPYDRVKIRWIRRLHFHTGHLVFAVTRQLFNRYEYQQNGPVEVETFQGREVGFLGAYVDAALARKAVLEMDPSVRVAASRLRAVFFIPTKYRVYAPLLPQPGDRVMAEPAPAFTATRAYFDPLGVPVVDLTPGLRQAAAEALPRGEWVYWRDDSHWNALGAKTAAADVANFLRHQ